MISDKIAFVILTWNSKQYLDSCLESVLSLPATDLHIYIVDNGSTDGTSALLDTYQKTVPTLISVTYLSQNEGTSKSQLSRARKILAFHIEKYKKANSIAI